MRGEELPQYPVSPEPESPHRHHVKAPGSSCEQALAVT